MSDVNNNQNRLSAIYDIKDSNNANKTLGDYKDEVFLEGEGSGHEDEILSFIKKEFKIDDKEARLILDAAIELANEKVGTGKKPKTSDIISQLETMLIGDEEGEEDISEAIEVALKDIIGSGDKLEKSHAQHIADLLGIEQEDAELLITITNGNIQELIDIIAGSDDKISLKEFKEGTNITADKLGASKKFLDDFNSQFGDNGSQLIGQSFNEKADDIVDFLVKSLSLDASDKEEIKDALKDKIFLKDGKITEDSIAKIKIFAFSYLKNKDDTDGGGGGFVNSITDTQESLSTNEDGKELSEEEQRQNITEAIEREQKSIADIGEKISSAAGNVTKLADSISESRKKSTPKGGEIE